MMSILYSLTAVSVTVSTIQYSNAYHSIYNGFNINNYYIHYYKNVFAHKRYYYAPMQQALSLPCSEYTNAHA